MPVIDVNLGDLRELLGRDVTLEELNDRLPMMGTGWEGETDEGFQLEVFPNRPDMLSIEGLARAYATFSGLRAGLREYDVKEAGYEVTVEKKVEKVRPWFVTAVVKNVEFDDPLIRSIIQMQEKLHVTHGRRRRKVAIGLHNLAPVEFPVVYTTKPPEFKFRPLGERFEKDLTKILTEMHTGREYAWIVEGFEEYPMILDAKGMVLSMPPIINGEYTRIDETTRDLFIDVTGTDLKAITEVLNIIVTTFADRGAEIYAVENRYPDGTVLKTPDLSPREMDIDNGYVNATLGMEFPPEETAGYLAMMGHDAEPGETLRRRHRLRIRQVRPGDPGHRLRGRGGSPRDLQPGPQELPRGLRVPGGGHIHDVQPGEALHPDGHTRGADSRDLEPQDGGVHELEEQADPQPPGGPEHQQAPSLPTEHL
jgi:phenylalanyl-tRNA synthetase beta chain